MHDSLRTFRAAHQAAEQEKSEEYACNFCTACPLFCHRGHAFKRAFLALYALWLI